MRRATDFQDLAYSMFNEAAKRGLMFHAAEDVALNGRTIQVEGQEWLNFGSCSYLGLEMHPALKEGVIDAVSRFGTQFSSSRAMVSAPPYAELEDLLGQVFGETVLLSASTSMGHVGTIPMLIGEEDAIILDQQVHMSVETATRLARVNGTPIELIRHNRLDLLEEAVLRLKRHRRHIWYMADGLYSMYGDLAPLDGLMALLERHEQLRLYVDDAHAMSWCGTHGRGFVLGNYPLHERMVVATSLNKAFACAGGVLLMKDEAMRRKIRTVGGPLIYSGPIQPPMLGAALASARLHLSPEIVQLQESLRERIRLCNRLLTERGLPLISRDETPVRFVGTGMPQVTYKMVQRMQEAGLYINAATFPVVPMKRAGLRFTLNNHLRPEDIERLADELARHLPEVLEEEGSSLAEVQAAFGLEVVPAPSPAPESLVERIALVPKGEQLSLERRRTIQQVDRAEWDALLGDFGSFSWEGLELLEKTFRENPRPEDNWNFYYYIVRDPQGAPVLATFFTEALWKDDMVAAARVSKLVEDYRKNDPYYLTTRTFGMGALLTEGDHMYLDRERDWKQALSLLLRAAKQDQEACGARMLVFRDLDATDGELEEFLLGQGFANFAMPESLEMSIDWTTEQEYMARLSLKSRRHQRLAVRPWDDAYEVEVLPHDLSPDDELLRHLYGLYQNVKARGLEFNTFDLPPQLFRNMLGYACWETVVLRPKAPGAAPAAFFSAFIGAQHYAPIVGGLDYDYVTTQGAYRQLLKLAVRRAQHHGKQRVLLGMGAAFEKQRFGAVASPRSIFFRTEDEYPMDVLAKLFAEAKG